MALCFLWVLFSCFLCVAGGDFKAFALSGRRGAVAIYPGRCPGLGAIALSGRLALIPVVSGRLALIPVVSWALGVGLLLLLPPLVVEGSTDGGTELRVFRYSESYAVELLHGWEYLAALGQEGEIAYHHEVLDARFQ